LVSQNNYSIDHGATGIYEGDGFTTPVSVTDSKISFGPLLNGAIKDQLTVAALIRVNVTPNTNRSFFGCGNPLATFAYSCFSKTTGEFGFSINASSSGIAYSTYAPASGEICLVVLRYDGANLSGWINGVQVLADTARTGNINNLTQNVTIGYTGSTSVKTASATHMFHAIWNRALTENEIHSLTVNPWQLFQSQPLLFNVSTGSGTTSLIVADCAEVVSSDSPALVQQHILVTADGAHVLSSDAPTLVQQHILVASDGSHVVDSDAPTLTQNHVLTIGDGAHVVSSDTPTIVQQHQLTIDNSINIITSDEVTLDVSTQLEIADSSHVVTSDTPALTQAHTLVVVDGIDVITSDVPTLVQNITLVVADAADVVTSDEVSLSSLVELVIADGSSVLVSDVVDLITGFSASDNTHVVASDSPTLIQQHLLVVADSYLAITSDNISSFAARLLVVNDSYLIATSDVVTLLTPTGASGRAKTKLVASSSRNILQVSDTYCSFSRANSRVELGR